MNGNIMRRVEKLERETSPAETIELHIETGVRRGNGDDGVVKMRIPAGRLESGRGESQ